MNEYVKAQEQEKVDTIFIVWLVLSLWSLKVNLVKINQLISTALFPEFDQHCSADIIYLKQLHCMKCEKIFQIISKHKLLLTATRQPIFNVGSSSLRLALGRRRSHILPI